MSREVLDELIRRAVSDEGFRAKLTEDAEDPKRFEEVVSGLGLTPDEVERLRRVGMSSSSIGFPFAKGLNERLAK